MKLHGGVWVAVFLGATIFGTTTLRGAENSSAVELARAADDQFHRGEYRKAQKLWDRAVRLDSTNAHYREALGETYEREAEQASFPFVLTEKARSSFVRALRLEPGNRAALEGLIDLQQEPIGLCEGDLTRASDLIERLRRADPEAALHKQAYWEDAKYEQAQPGQRFLCGPVKISRVITDHFVPRASLKSVAAIAPKPDGVGVAEAKSGAKPAEPGVIAGQ